MNVEHYNEKGEMILEHPIDYRCIKCSGGNSLDIFGGSRLSADGEVRVVPQLSEKEVRTTSRTGGEKGVKLERYDLLPWNVLDQIAKHYGKGAAKYDDHNWRKGYEWSKSYAALQRHLSAFWQGEDFDACDDECGDQSDGGCDIHTGSHHLTAAGFHVFALLYFSGREQYAEYDDRYMDN